MIVMLKVEIVGLFEWLKLRSNLDQPLICFLQDPSELSCTIQCRLATKKQQQGWPVLHVSGCYMAGLNLILLLILHLNLDSVNWKSLLI